MKKIILCLTVFLLGILIVIIVLSTKKQVNYKEILYSIPRIDTYDSTKEERMHFEVFINSKNHLISYVDKNQYSIKDGGNQYLLNHVTVRNEEDSSLKNEIFYKYIIECDLFGKTEQNLLIQDYELIIENDKSCLSFQMGDIEIYNQNHKLLEFSDLYGNYAYVNQELHFIGITIKLNHAYKILENVSIGPAFGALHAIEEDCLRDSECLEASLHHSVISLNTLKNRHYLTAKEDYYFIPISYPTNLRLITNGIILFQIDGEVYYLEKFSYLANDIHLDQYPYSMKEGRLQYA